MKFNNFGYISDGTNTYISEYSVFLARWGIKTIHCFDKSKQLNHSFVLFGDNERYLKLVKNSKFLLEEEQMTKLLNSIDSLTTSLQTAMKQNKQLMDENNLLLGIDGYDLYSE